MLISYSVWLHFIAFLNPDEGNTSCSYWYVISVRDIIVIFVSCKSHGYYFRIEYHARTVFDGCLLQTWVYTEGQFVQCATLLS